MPSSYRSQWNHKQEADMTQCSKGRHNYYRNTPLSRTYLSHDLRLNSRFTAFKAPCQVKLMSPTAASLLRTPDLGGLTDMQMRDTFCFLFFYLMSPDFLSKSSSPGPSLPLFPNLRSQPGLLSDPISVIRTCPRGHFKHLHPSLNTHSPSHFLPDRGCGLLSRARIKPLPSLLHRHWQPVFGTYLICP